MIRKRKGKYVLLSEEGEVLGTHETKSEAIQQEKAIEAQKAEKGKRKK